MTLVIFFGSDALSRNAGERWECIMTIPNKCSTIFTNSTLHSTLRRTLIHTPMKYQLNRSPLTATDPYPPIPLSKRRESRIEDGTPKERNTLIPTGMENMSRDLEGRKKLPITIWERSNVRRNTLTAVWITLFRCSKHYYLVILNRCKTKEDIIINAPIPYHTILYYPFGL